MLSTHRYVLAQMLRNVFTLACLILTSGCVTPLTYTVNDPALYSTIPTRPFYIAEPSGDCTKNLNYKKFCVGAISNGLKAYNYRVIPAPTTIQDSNVINCSLELKTQDFDKTDTPYESAEASFWRYFTKGDSFPMQGSDATTKYAFFVHCSVLDTISGKPIYDGTGYHSQLMPNYFDLDIYFSQIMTTAVMRSISKMNPGEKRQDVEVFQVQAEGSDDGIRSTREQDLREAIDSAKVWAVAMISSRVRRDTESKEEFVNSNSSDSSYESKWSGVEEVFSDGTVLTFDIIEDLGYVGSTYKVVIEAEVVRN